MTTKPRHCATALILAGSIAALLAGQSAQAAAKTWNLASGGNISAGITSPVSGDNLIFSNAAGGTVVFDSAVYGGSTGNASSLAGISFTGTLGAYILDLSASGFNISNPNAITMASTVANDQTIGTSAGSGTIFIGISAAGSTGYFANSSTTNKLIINSNIANGSTNNNSLVIGNVNGGAGTSGNIDFNGGISGMANGVTKTGTGTATFSGANTYTGNTTVNGGSFTVAGSTSASAITVNGGTYNLTGTQSGGSVTINGNNTTSGSFGTFSESAAGVISGTTTLTVNSAQTFGGVAGSATLAGNNTYSGTTSVGSISNNTASPYNIASLVAPTLTLSGANNGQGTITLNSGATLKLDFGASGAPATNILNNSTLATAVTLTGGTLNVTGNSGATNSQRINGLTFSANTSSALRVNEVGGGTLSMTLAGLTRGAGSTVDLTLPTLGTVVSTTTASIGTRKVLVNSTGVGAAYATVGGLDWATNNAGTIGKIAGYDVNTFTAGADTDITGTQTPGALFTINTLRFNSDGATLNNTGASTISSGGVLVTANAGTTGVTITGGTSIKSGSGNEMVIINNGKLTFDTPIVNTSGAITVSSTNGLGVSTFGGNNTLTTLNVTSGSASFSGANTITGAVTVGNGATLTLSGSNTTSSNFGFAGQGGGTLVLAGAGALGTGVLNFTNTNNNSANIIKFASDTAVSTGATKASISSSNNNVTTLNFIMDRATAGTSAVNETFSSSGLGQQGNYNFLLGSNYTAGYTLPTVDLGNATLFNAAKTTFINASGANVTLGTVAPSASLAVTITLALGGVSTGNLITGAIADNTLSVVALSKLGTGIWTLQGTNTNTGATTVSGGTLVLDYGTNNNSKISSTGVLTLSGGTLQLKGGSTAQAVASTTFNTGQSAITRNTGTSTIALGAITSTAGAADFTSGVATTTTANGTNGLLGGLARYTVGGADWAVSGASGTNPITALGSYTNVTTLGANPTGGTNTVNYLLNGAGTTTTSGSLTLGTLKISAGTTLALNGANTLTVGSATSGTAGLLFTSSSAFSITGGAGSLKAGTGNITLEDWGTGVLTLPSISNSLDKFGTGKAILSANSSGGTTVSVYAGTLQYSADAQFSNGTQAVTINGSYGSGAALVANTAGGAITTARNITLGAQGGNYIDIVNGGTAANTLTLSGVISGTQSSVANNIVTFGGASAVDATNNAATSGTIVLSGANTYSGGTTFAGGTVNLGVAENAGANGPLGIGGTLTFTGGTLQYSASNQFDYSSRFSPVASQSFKVDTNNQAVKFASPLAGANSTLTKSGTGTLTLSGANTYTGPTTVTGGTLEVSGSINATISATPASAISVTSGTLMLSGGSERVNDAAGLTLGSGGTVAYANALSNATETMASLTLTGNSTLDFGTGSGDKLLFTGSITGLASNTLSIYNWSGPVGDSAQDVLAYGNTLSAGDLANINFYSGAIGTEGSTFLGSGTEISFGGPGFQVVPIPEPSSTALLGAAALLGLVGFRERRRLLGLKRS